MTTPRIDVRKIVLDVVELNPEAAQAYLLEPAMRHGVEVTIGVLGRTAEVLMGSGRHTPGETADLIRDIAVACSGGSGQEDRQVIAVLNTRLFPPT